jgi:hypothetical protein
MRSEEVNLSPLVGAVCTYVGLGSSSISLCFDRVGTVRMECPYELRSGSGELLESRDASANEKEGSRLGTLLMLKVASFEFSAPSPGLCPTSDRFVLRFENGCTLAVIESDHNIESAVIEYESAQPRLQVI